MPSLQLCIFCVVLCSIFVFSVITNYEKLSIYFVLHFRSNNEKKERDSVCMTEYEIEKEEYLRRDTK
jgi:hypothetical protein